MEESGKITATATVSVEPAPPPPPFFTLDLSPRYAARNFATLADLKEWLLREQKFFSFTEISASMLGSTS